jgi:hypothetical protein
MRRLLLSLVAATLVASAAPARAGDADAIGSVSELTRSPGWRIALDATVTAHGLPRAHEAGYKGTGGQLEVIWQVNDWAALVTRASLDRGTWFGARDQPPYPSTTSTMWNGSAVAAARACAFGLVCGELGLGLGVERTRDVGDGTVARTTEAVFESRVILEIPLHPKLGLELQAGIARAPSGREQLAAIGLVFR